MEWIKFYESLIGYQITKDDVSIGKAGIFNKFTPNFPDLTGQDEEQLQQILDNTHSEYTKSNKENFIDGKYVGLLEGASAVRQYKLCPEKKLRKKRVPNFKD